MTILNDAIYESNDELRTQMVKEFISHVKELDPHLATSRAMWTRGKTVQFKADFLGVPTAINVAAPPENPNLDPILALKGTLAFRPATFGLEGQRCMAADLSDGRILFLYEINGQLVLKIDAYPNNVGIMMTNGAAVFVANIPNSD